MTAAIGVDARVTGAQRYSVDVERPGMLHAAFVRSPYAHARVGRSTRRPFPTAASRWRPTTSRTSAATAARRATSACSPTSRGYAGDVVAAVAAPTRAAARAAAAARRGRVRGAAGGLRRGRGGRRRARRSCTPTPRRRPSEAVSIGVRPLAGTNVCHRFRLAHGDVAAGFAEADVIVEETFRTPSAAHAPMEPHAALAEWDDGRLDGVDGHADAVQHARRPRRRVRARCRSACASSRRRWAARSGPRRSSGTEALVAALARKAGAPGQARRSTAPRSSSRSTATRRRSASGSARARDGTLAAKEVDCWVDTGAYADCGPGVATKMGYAGRRPVPDPARARRRAARSTRTSRRTARTAATARCSRCGPRERAMDVLAERLGMSPLDLRLRNLLRDGDRYCTGEIDARRALRRVPAGRRRRGRLTRRTRAARACACCSRGCRRRAAPRSRSSAAPVGYVVRCATSEMGQGVAARDPALAAELLGVEPEPGPAPRPGHRHRRRSTRARRRAARRT